jgi:phosphatidylserine/phosphatidylglycerophosphate/cardiolipin synthase-like enzyme
VGGTANIREDLSSWFLPPEDANPVIGNPVLTGNEVTAFIEYKDYYRALAEAVSKTGSSDHFIYFADWQLILDTWMDAQSGRKTFRTLLQEADARGVAVRSMLYMGQWVKDPVGNDRDCDWINDELKNGAAILDGRYLIAGSHHQKFAVVKNSDGVVAFCGGMDIAEDRQQRDGGPSPPDKSKPVAWHDVQVRVVGPAALPLWRTFALRWTDYQYAFSRWVDYNKYAASAVKASVKVAPSPPSVPDKMSVQVIRTAGNGSRHEGLQRLDRTSLLYMENVPSTYAFAPAGEMTIYNLI